MSRFILFFFKKSKFIDVPSVRFLICLFYCDIHLLKLWFLIENCFCYRFFLVDLIVTASYIVKEIIVMVFSTPYLFKDFFVKNHQIAINTATTSQKIYCDSHFLQRFSPSFIKLMVLKITQRMCCRKIADLQHWYRGAVKGFKES